MTALEEEGTALGEPRAPARARPGISVSESWIFRAAVAVIALHIVDDEFLRPPSGSGGPNTPPPSANALFHQR